MTANEIFNTACLICLRSEDEFVEQSTALSKKKLLIVNLALREFNINAVTDLNQEVTADNGKLDAICYMAARVIASYFNDSVKLAEITEIFAAKRAKALCQTVVKTDILPVV